MANPRKFSEKIALHTHRQAEETARFEQIMKEVSDATARQDDSCHSIQRVYRESRARSQGGPIRRPQDRKHDTSPYSTSPSPFLSPPPDTSWRRTNSDSALHHSAMQGSGINDRSENLNSRWILQTLNGPQAAYNRPRSCCDVPRVPGINVYPSTHEPGSLQIPIGNNTGSLPDLTNVHFPSPIHAPLDDDQDPENSSYSTNPSKLLTTSAQVIPNHNRLQSSGFFGNKHQTLQKKFGNMVDGVDFASISALDGMYREHREKHYKPQQQRQISPLSQSPTQSINYRNPRPSPQPSPGLGGRISEPCSPNGTPSPINVSSPETPGAISDFPLLNQQQLQQHFEQFSVTDLPLSPASSLSYIDNSKNMHAVQIPPQNVTELPGLGNSELPADTGYFSTSPSSQFVYSTTATTLQTAPNTPTSIPDIILTDFSSEDDLARQNLVFTKQIEAELLSDESLREGLGPLDLDGLQMLSDSSINLIPDSVEDHFRLDRL